jgi:hypothetical protein
VLPGKQLQAREGFLAKVINMEEKVEGRGERIEGRG